MCLSRAALAVLVGLIAFYSPAAPTQVTSFGTRTNGSHQAMNPFSNVQWTEYPVSDDYARAFVAKYDAYAASRMLHRVGKAVEGATPFSTDDSSWNWGGFVADTGGAFQHRSNGAKSYFYAQPATGGGHIGSWVGIGGNYWDPNLQRGTNLLQTGLDQTSAPMQAFYELVPSADPRPQYVAVFANPGDLMWAFIHWDSSTNLWYVQVENATTGQWYPTHVSYQPDTRTSEWITEDQYDSGNVPAFNAVHFWNGYWWDESDVLQVIASGESTTVWRDIMTAPSPYTGCIYPTLLYGSGETFDNRAPSCLP